MRVSNANNYDRCPRKLLPAQKINRHDVRGERRKHNLVQTFFLMDKIFTSSLVSHRGKKWVLICFDRDAEWNRRMKTVEGSRWSNTPERAFAHKMTVRLQRPYELATGVKELTYSKFT